MINLYERFVRMLILDAKILFINMEIFFNLYIFILLELNECHHQFNE